MPPSRVPLVYGSAAFGKPNSGVTRIHDLETCQQVLDVFCKDHGYKELDNGRAYGNGSSEEFVSQLELYGARVDTKAAPPLTPEKLRESIYGSMKALGKNKIRIFYLHAPDRDTSYEVTMEEVNKCYKEGFFEEFGLSNFWAWEVIEIYTMCKERGWVLPTVYQGPYCLFSRTNEPELFPALRKFNIRFMAFSPLAGGLLAESLKSKDDPGQPGGRFDATTRLGQQYRKYYTEGKEFEALELLRGITDKHGITLAELALRWLQHHSALTPQDGVIIGASSVKQIKSNCVDSEKGPLPEEVLAVAEQAWMLVKADAELYSW